MSLMSLNVTINVTEYLCVKYTTSLYIDVKITAVLENQHLGSLKQPLFERQYKN